MDKSPAQLIGELVGLLVGSLRFVGYLLVLVDRDMHEARLRGRSVPPEARAFRHVAAALVETRTDANRREEAQTEHDEPAPGAPSGLLTTKQVASHLGKSQRTVQDMIADERIAAVKIGRGWRVEPDEVDRIAREGI